LDREAAFADFNNAGKNLGYGKKRGGDGFVTLALDEFKNRAVAARVVLDFEAFSGEFVDEF